MPKNNSKKRYEVGEQESIAQCLDRMKKDGYAPVRRAEEPIFKEVTENGEKTLEPVGRTIVFHAVKQ
ncbi:NETI motif-containing protein [Halobacillus sp. A1]|uniref:NETI motif-containing protein n=1 Tax=Halobacillus sp. A1 TaxID=2880262 RepID=UPI0020A661AD|nr:NETI motif-containing protein [Halobacillus sp. A1]MCP3029976.1 NETI motif-containing protein [Halobacillus sp. A1]